MQPTLREIFKSVINDMICADRSRSVHIPRAAYGSDLSPERLGKLNRECTDTARCAIDENLLPSLDPSVITKTLKGSDAGHGYGCCLLERYVAWLCRQTILTGAHVLRNPSHPFPPERAPEH